MAFIELLNQNTVFFYFVAALIGALFGSFINVVIYRLPRMMERAWQADCRATLGIEEDPAPKSRENLMTPASTCTACGHRIRFWENIPVLSYLWLKARCSACKAPISFQYPLVEILAALAVLMAAVHYGVSLPMIGAAAFGLALIALSGIDTRTQLLPDSITLPLLWAGLIINLSAQFTDIQSSVIGAVIGYLCLWLIYHVFKWLTGKEGMGYGDFKLLGAIGAWAGWQALPLVVLLSSIIGALFGIALILGKRQGRDVPIPFGPYLALAGWVALLYGPALNHWYLNILLGST